METIRLNPLLEFFVTSDEIGHWAAGWIERHGLYGLMVRRSPFHVSETIDCRNCQSMPAMLSQFDELVLGIELPDRSARTAAELVSLNPDRLELNLPRMTATTLRAAGIGSVSQNEKALKTWRLVAKDVLEKTAAGMWMISMSTRAKRRYANLRYSSGAARCHDEGVALLTLAAETPVLIEEPG